MSELSDAELMQVIGEGESDRVEFKESLSGSAAERIRQAICAFANDLPGHGTPGLVFWGVKDDRTIVVISATDRLLQLLADMKTDGNILPPPTPAVAKRVLQGREVALVIVEPSNSPPVRTKAPFIFVSARVAALPQHRTSAFSTRSGATVTARLMWPPFLPPAWPTST